MLLRSATAASTMSPAGTHVRHRADGLLETPAGRLHARQQQSRPDVTGLKVRVRRAVLLDKCHVAMNK